MSALRFAGLGLLIILACLSLLQQHQVSATHFRCKKGKAYVYSYVSESESFEKQKEMITTKDNEAGPRLQVLKAKVEVTCLEQVYSQAKRQQMNVYSMKLLHFQYLTGDKKALQEDHRGGFELDDSKEKAVLFVQTQGGKVLRVVHHKADSKRMMNVKKNIINLLQAKAHGGCRVETGQIGKHSICYERAINDKGEVFIEANITQKDILKPADQRTNPRRIQYKEFREIEFSTTGIVKEAIQTVHFAQAPPEDRDSAFKEEKEAVGYSKGSHTDEATKMFGSGGPIQTNTKTSLSFEEERSYNKEHSGPVYKFIQEAKGLLKRHGVEFVGLRNDFKGDDLTMSKEYILDIKAAARQQLLDEYPFDQNLRKFRLDGARDINLLTELDNYMSVAATRSKVQFVYDYCFGSIALKRMQKITSSSKNKKRQYSAKILDFQKACQHLLAVSQRVSAQKLMLRSMRLNVELLKHGMMSMLKLKKPLRVMNGLLKALQDRGNVEKFLSQRVTKADHRAIRNEAFLIRAAVAKLMPDDEAKAIISEYLDHVKLAHERGNNHALTTVTHALANAGDHVPLEVTEKLLYHPSSHVSLAAAQGLRSRTQRSAHKNTNDFIHKIVGDHDLPDHIRAAAVQSQIEREDSMSHLIVGDSMEAFAKSLIPSTLQDDVLTPAAIVHYFAHVDNEKAHETLFSHLAEELDNYDDETKALFLGKVGRWVKKKAKKVGRAIKKTVKKVGKAIKKGVKAVYKATVGKVVEAVKKVGKIVKKVKAQFGKARFEGQKRCFTVSTKNEKMCVWDVDMANFITQRSAFVPLQQMDHSKSFVWEKLLGAKIAHIYLGFAGYAGFSIRCGDLSANIIGSIFARGQVSGKAFNRRFSIVSAHAYIQKRRNQPIPNYDALEDSVYVKISRAVVVHRRIVPCKIRQAINSCYRKVKPLYTKRFDGLIKYKAIIPAGPIVLAIEISSTGSLGVNQVTTVCLGNLQLTVGVEPYFTFGLRAQGGIDFWVIKGGAFVNLYTKYAVEIKTGLMGCEIGVAGVSKITPLSLKVGLSASFFGKKKDWTIVDWKGKSKSGTLFKMTFQIPGTKNLPRIGEPTKIERPKPNAKPSAGDKKHAPKKKVAISDVLKKIREQNRMRRYKSAVFRPRKYRQTPEHVKRVIVPPKVEMERRKKGKPVIRESYRETRHETRRETQHEVRHEIRHETRQSSRQSYSRDDSEKSSHGEEKWIDEEYEKEKRARQREQELCEDDDELENLKSGFTKSKYQTSQVQTETNRIIKIIQGRLSRETEVRVSQRKGSLLEKMKQWSKHAGGVRSEKEIGNWKERGFAIINSAIELGCEDQIESWKDQLDDLTVRAKELSETFLCKTTKLRGSQKTDARIRVHNWIRFAHKMAQRLKEDLDEISKNKLNNFCYKNGELVKDFQKFTIAISAWKKEGVAIARFIHVTRPRWTFDLNQTDKLNSGAFKKIEKVCKSIENGSINTINWNKVVKKRTIQPVHIYELVERNSTKKLIREQKKMDKIFSKIEKRRYRLPFKRPYLPSIRRPRPSRSRRWRRSKRRTVIKRPTPRRRRRRSTRRTVIKRPTPRRRRRSVRRTVTKRPTPRRRRRRSSRTKTTNTKTSKDNQRKTYQVVDLEQVGEGNRPFLREKRRKEEELKKKLQEEARREEEERRRRREREEEEKRKREEAARREEERKLAQRKTFFGIDGATLFTNLYNNYPRMSNKDLYTEIGGVFPEYNFQHSCAIRLSYAFIKSGMTVYEGGDYNDKEDRSYIIRVRTFVSFLNSKFGEPVQVNVTARTEQKGVIMFRDCRNFGSATGHVDFWNGNSCAGTCYWSDCRLVNLWVLEEPEKVEEVIKEEKKDNEEEEKDTKEEKEEKKEEKKKGFWSSKCDGDVVHKTVSWKDALKMAKGDLKNIPKNLKKEFKDKIAAQKKQIRDKLNKAKSGLGKAKDAIKKAKGKFKNWRNKRRVKKKVNIHKHPRVKKGIAKAKQFYNRHTGKPQHRKRPPRPSRGRRTPSRTTSRPRPRPTPRPRPRPQKKKSVGQRFMGKFKKMHPNNIRNHPRVKKGIARVRKFYNRFRTATVLRHPQLHHIKLPKRPEIHTKTTKEAVASKSNLLPSTLSEELQQNPLSSRGLKSEEEQTQMSMATLFGYQETEQDLLDSIEAVTQMDQCGGN